MQLLRDIFLLLLFNFEKYPAQYLFFFKFQFQFYVIAILWAHIIYIFCEWEREGAIDQATVAIQIEIVHFSEKHFPSIYVLHYVMLFASFATAQNKSYHTLTHAHAHTGMAITVSKETKCNTIKKNMRNCHWQTFWNSLKDWMWTASNTRDGKQNIIFMKLQKRNGCYFCCLAKQFGKQNIHLHKTTILYIYICQSDKNWNSSINFVYCHH